MTMTKKCQESNKYFVVCMVMIIRGQSTKQKIKYKVVQKDGESD